MPNDTPNPFYARQIVEGQRVWDNLFPDHKSTLEKIDSCIASHIQENGREYYKPPILHTGGGQPVVHK
jgi:hypothetical protein